MDFGHQTTISELRGWENNAVRPMTSQIQPKRQENSKKIGPITIPYSKICRLDSLRSEDAVSPGSPKTRTLSLSKQEPSLTMQSIKKPKEDFFPKMKNSFKLAPKAEIKFDRNNKLSFNPRVAKSSLAEFLARTKLQAKKPKAKPTKLNHKRIPSSYTFDRELNGVSVLYKTMFF